ncbi:MAG: ABC transporter ATP-binding protein [Granulosicoccus sp.]|nr:ABC transporter ATP-binding protein [Granulosicoccus sp.]
MYGTPATQQKTDESAALVQMSQITKSFPGCLANDSIDLTLHAGTIHALLGENGAGKSTLVKILYGLLMADSGEIRWQGRALKITSPTIARELGIAMVFQHFSLFESLTVLENISLGMRRDANQGLRQQVIEVSTRYGLPLDPDRAVFSLSVGERQRIEIVRCLLQQPKLLIMDEPTSVLTPQEVEELFSTLRSLADEGLSILYISHKLEEIRSLCSGSSILRQGRKVAETDPRTETTQSLAALMMGESVPLLSARTKSVSGKSLLELRALSTRSSKSTAVALHDINLTVAAGEIVGVAGVAGNGQDELMQLISGEQSVESLKSIWLDGDDISSLTAGQRRKRGLCCVPEQRLGHAAVPNLSLADNVFLTAHHRRKLQHFGVISRRRSRDFAEEIIRKFDVHCSGVDALASSLSGGNLQKFVVGREMLQSPRVLVVAQPTWGVDAGAATAIREALEQLANQGVGVLLISQDLDELLLMTDRIAAVCAGRLSDFHHTRSVTVQQMGLLMGGVEVVN